VSRRHHLVEEAMRLIEWDSLGEVLISREVDVYERGWTPLQDVS
jgi:hypothetical protein